MAVLSELALLDEHGDDSPHGAVLLGSVELLSDLGRLSTVAASSANSPRTRGVSASCAEACISVFGSKASA